MWTIPALLFLVGFFHRAAPGVMARDLMQTSDAAGRLPVPAYHRQMRANRSIPSAQVVPVLIYPDVRAAVAWLESALGCTERVRIGDAHRAQLALGPGR